MKNKLMMTIFGFAMVSCGTKKAEAGVSSNPTKEDTLLAANSETLIDPAGFDFSKPVPAAKVYRSIMFFYETEFQLLVYPYNDKIIPYAQAYSLPGSAELSLDFTLREKAEKQLDKNTPVVVKGKIEGTNYGRLNLVDAVIVSEGGSPVTVAFEINKHDSTRIYDPKQLYDFILAWESKPIIIQDFYQGYTQSNSLNHEVMERRVDVGPDAMHVIGCAFDTDPAVGDHLSAGIDQIIIKGIISQELSYGRPYMKKCEVIR